MTSTYTFIYIYTYFEFNKVIKVVTIKHKRIIITEKTTPDDVHQPSMPSVTFLTATYFSTSCHVRKVKIIFLYYDCHKKRSLFISLLVYFLFSSQLCFFIPISILDLVCGNLFCFSISPDSKVLYTLKKSNTSFKVKDIYLA